MARSRSQNLTPEACRLHQWEDMFHTDENPQKALHHLTVKLSSIPAGVEEHIPWKVDVKQSEEPPYDSQIRILHVTFFYMLQLLV